MKLEPGWGALLWGFLAAMVAFLAGAIYVYYHYWEAWMFFLTSGGFGASH